MASILLYSNSDSPSSSFLLHILFGIPLWGSLFILPPFFIYILLFIYISIDIFPLHSLDYNIILSYLLCCSNYSSFDYWEHFQPRSLSLWCEPMSPYLPFLNLLFGSVRYSRLTFYFFLFGSKISHFFRDAWILLLNNWHLETKVCTLCMPIQKVIFTLYYFEKKSMFMVINIYHENWGE